MEVASLGLKVEGIGNIDQATSSLGRFTQSADSAEKSASALDPASRKSSQSVQQLGKSSQSTSSSLNALASTAMKVGGVLVAAFSVSKVVQYADAWSDMQSRVGAATGSMDTAGASMQRLLQIANASYSPLEQTAEIYSRNVSTFRDLGRSATEAADFTESLNNMLVLTATRGERAASVQNALSKAMAVGKIEADGLETVLANGGEVAQALARELGTTVSGLRQMASDGKITSDVIANSVVKSLDDVRDRAAEMPATMGDAFVRVGNNVTALVGTFDQATGASGALAAAIIELSDTALEMATSEDVIAGLLAWQGALQAIGRDIIELDRLISGFTSNAEEDASSIGFSFAEIPANIRAAIQIATVEIASFIDAQLNGIQALAAAVKALPDGPSAAVDAFNAVRSQMAALGDARMQSIEAILQERDAIVNGARDAAKAYKESTRQTLEMNGALGETARVAANASSEISKAAQKNANAIENEISALERAAKVWGMTAGEVKIYDLTMKGASESQLEYARSLIATVEGLEAQKKAEEDAAREIERRKKAFGDDPISSIVGKVNPLSGGMFDNQMARYEAEALAEQQRYEQQQERLREALDLQLVTRQQYAELEVELAQVSANRVAQIEQAKQQLMLQSGEQMFGSLAGLAQTFVGEQSAAYQALFAIQKGFAVATALMNAPKSYSDAYAATVGIPVVGPILAPIAGATAAAAQVAQAAAIKGVTPGFQGGGYTGNMGVSDVAGVVHGREYVFDAAATSRIGVPTLEAIRSGRPLNSSGGIMNGSGSDASQPITIAPQVVVNGDPDKATIARIEKATADGAKLAYQQISNDLATGRGSVSKSLQAGYGVSRRKG
jgi:tape measure domain-containing protein